MWSHDGGDILDNILAISEIIKRYIKMRGYTIQQVADKLGVNYKTFVGILNRDAIDAKLLFSSTNFNLMNWIAYNGRNE